ncbi:MAG: MAPEG family protein, partial [Pseudomonadales bacterium]|nr:MAPEG family protein [Pseudomonadales bacterium]
FTNPASVTLPILVVIFTISRLIHAYGMLCKKPVLRQAGAAITYASQGAAFIALLASLNA